MIYFETKIENVLRSIYLFIIISVCYSCQKGNRIVSDGMGDTLVFKYAKNITIVRHHDCSVVTLKDPWHEGKNLQTYYLINRCDSSSAPRFPADRTIYVPLKRSVVFTSSHCALLSSLNVLEQVKGICDAKYVLQKEVKTLLQNKTITDCGDGMMPQIEKIIQLHADAVLLSPFENSGGFGKLENIGIPLIQCADYMEPKALGRAEWMKFYGILYGKEHQADSLFAVVDSVYNNLRHEAWSMAVGRSVMFDRKTANVWYCPGGESTIAQLVADANGVYPFSDDKHSGSVPFSPEQVLTKCNATNIWLVKYNGAVPLTLKDLKSEYSGYTELEAFKNHQVFACNCSEKAYYDEIPFRPDYLLREMMLLLHPGECENGKLRYYNNVPEK